MTAKPLTPAKLKKALKKGKELNKEIKKEINKMKLTPEEKFSIELSLNGGKFLNEPEEEIVYSSIRLAAIALASHLTGLPEFKLDLSIGIRKSTNEIVVYLPKITKKMTDLIPKEWAGCNVIVKKSLKIIPA